MRKAVVYRITNEVNGKQYHGVSVAPAIRVLGHLGLRHSSFHKYSKLIKAAVEKYGLENFSFKVILIASEDYCYDVEPKIIEAYNSLVPNGYNIAEGGDRPPNARGRKVVGRKRKTVRSTEESERKSASQAGEKNHRFGTTKSAEQKVLAAEKSRANWANPEYVEKQSSRHKEAMQLPSTREALSRTLKGKPKSEKWKANMKASHARRKALQEGGAMHLTNSFSEENSL
jgi:group I intron endonuclease